MLRGFLMHPIVLTVFFTWVAAGVLKYLSASFKKGSGKVSLFNELFTTGGMPSGHSASVSSLTAAVFFLEGVSVLFLACLVFSLIVIRDSFGVRWSVGEQAKILNKLAKHDHVQDKVRVVLGHTLSQAFAGIILGVVVAVVVHLLV
ncbi:divergent PAP2 family protein [Candidatus Woesearchaeota archaeon]|nr:divergent PAP2 family protein [Candidatus Woesearchaeota archaeon]